MRPITKQELSVTVVSEGSDTQPPASEIQLADGSAKATVDGAVLEAAVVWNHAYLVFLTDDIPHEDTLSIYLFDRELNCLDSATLGGLYSTGSFALQELSEPNRVQFRFIGDTDWSVELLPRPEFRLPFIAEPRGVSRKFGFSRHFRILGRPRPQ